MKRYTEYKDSGVEWLGQIPQHWKETKLKFIGYLYSGLTGKKGEDFANEKNSSNRPFIPFTNIASNEKIDVSALQYVRIEDNEEQNLVKKGDLFFMMSSENYDDVGKTTILLNEVGEVYLNSFCRGFRITDSTIDPSFLNYVLLSSPNRQRLLIEANGFTRINLKVGKINDLKVFFPPLTNEQTQIAQYLDHKTSQIDKLISDKEKLIELLNEERTVIINHAVTKGLNPEVPMKDSGIEWLGEVPEHWEVKKLKYLCSLISEKKDDFEPEVIIALENIESWTGRITGSLDINEVGSDLSLFRNGDVLFNKLRPYLAKAVLANHDGACVGELLVLRSTSEIMPEFLFRRMLSEIFISIIDGSTFGTKMPRASWDKFISQLAVPICGIDEQKEIILFISNQEKRINNLLEKIQQEIQLLKEYKTALISEVVTGKVDIRDELLKPGALT